MCLLVITLSSHTKRQKHSKADRNPSIYDGSLHIPMICNKNSRTGLKYKRYAHLGMARMHGIRFYFYNERVSANINFQVEPNF